MTGKELIDRINELGAEHVVFVDGYEIERVDIESDGDEEAICIVS
jgi:hypothetical protein